MWKDLVHILPYPLLILGEKNKIFMKNDAFSEMFLKELPPDEQHTLSTPLSDLFKGKDETGNINYEHKVLAITTVKTKFEFDTAHLILLNDITPIQLVEKSKAESKYRLAMITSLTHELRTPLNCIIGNNQILEEMQITDE
jgi:signal transduction histidine kinase